MLNDMVKMMADCPPELLAQAEQEGKDIMFDVIDGRVFRSHGGENFFICFRHYATNFRLIERVLAE
jgi:hypothetical protein